MHATYPADTSFQQNTGELPGQITSLSNASRPPSLSSFHVTTTSPRHGQVPGLHSSAKKNATSLLLSFMRSNTTALRPPLLTPLRCSAITMAFGHVTISLRIRLRPCGLATHFREWFNSLTPACTSCAFANAPRVGLQPVRQNDLTTDCWYPTQSHHALLSALPFLVSTARSSLSGSFTLLRVILSIGSQALQALDTRTSFLFAVSRLSSRFTFLRESRLLAQPGIRDTHLD